MSVGLIKDMKPETDGQHFGQQANDKYDNFKSNYYSRINSSYTFL